MVDVNFAHMPLYLKYASTLSDKRWRKDIKNIETINRDEGAANTPILKSDYIETWVLTQYLETMILRFDKNRSGQIEIREAFKLLWHFRSVLGNILGLNPDDDEDYAEMESFFTYSLKYGEMPNFEEPITQLRYENWKIKKAKWSLAADRGTLLAVLAFIAKRQ